MKEPRISWSAMCLVLILTVLCDVTQASRQLPNGLILETSTLNLGRVVLGSSTVVNEIVMNPTPFAITIGAASVEGTGLQLSGTSFPLVINAGRLASIGIGFAPSTAGQVSGSLVLSLNGTDPYVTIPLYGTAVAPGQLSANPPTISFGAGASSRQVVETLTNSGGTSVIVSAASTSGSGFVITRPFLPVVLNPGKSVSFNASSTNGAANGSINVTARLASWSGGRRGEYQNTASANASVVIPVSGSAVTGQLAAAPSSVSFGSAQVGSTQTQPATLANSGNAPVTITQAAASGTGFSFSGLPLPITLTPGQSVTFTAAFTPQSAGSAQGNISVASDASNATVNLPLSGSGTAVGQLSLSPASLSFGTVPVGKSSSLTATMAASGSNITVSSASTTSAEFSLGGMSLPFTIPAGQTASFTVTFTPQTSGTSAANIAFASNASPSTALEPVSGAGLAAPAPHNVALSWSPGSSSVTGYNVYRGPQSGGPYAKINSAPTSATVYGDGTVTSGQRYFYVTTALDSSGAESSHSNEVQVTIPQP